MPLMAPMADLPLLLSLRLNSPGRIPLALPFAPLPSDSRTEAGNVRSPGAAEDVPARGRRSAEAETSAGRSRVSLLLARLPLSPWPKPSASAPCVFAGCRGGRARTCLPAMAQRGRGWRVARVRPWRWAPGGAEVLLERSPGGGAARTAMALGAGRRRGAARAGGGRRGAARASAWIGDNGDVRSGAHLSATETSQNCDGMALKGLE